jgi:hypothetical protein
MPQRVSFATTQWKDKPNKPSCYTQAQWDARNSSKFNGAPFASPFAIDPETNGSIKTITKTAVQQYSQAIQAVDCPGCPFCLSQILDQIANIEPLEPEDVTVPCEKFDMKVWDGSTYFEILNTKKTVNWQTCWGNESRSMEIGIPEAKYPSASSDYYIPVCGPGTHIQEITRQEMINLVWRIATFDLDASGFSATTELSLSHEGSCDGKQLTIQVESKSEVKSSNKNKNPSHPAPQNESNLVNLNWGTQPEVGFKSNDSCDASAGTYSYSCTPTGGDGNITVSASVSPTSYKCGYLSASASGSINITLSSSIQRDKMIYFITDQSGNEKIYLDISKMINISLGTGNSSYYVDAGNVIAPFTANISFLGKTFNIGIQGPQNGSSTEYINFGFSNRKATVNRSFTAGSVTITPKKYYPYANSKGEAVYNVDDGNQLKDPLS